MSRRTKILIVFILIIAVLALLYWLFLRPKYLAPPTVGPEGEVTNVNQVPTQPVALPSVNIAPTVPAAELTSEEKLRSDLGRLAAAFAERFGSYSNQGDFENLLDLKPIMTAKMQRWVDDFIAQSKAGAHDSSVYFGVISKAISTKIDVLDETSGTAKITVGTQRREASGSMASSTKIYYQNLELAFVKMGEEWKVDEATWK